MQELQFDTDSFSYITVAEVMQGINLADMVKKMTINNAVIIPAPSDGSAVNIPQSDDNTYSISLQFQENGSNQFGSVMYYELPEGVQPDQTSAKTGEISISGSIMEDGEKKNVSGTLPFEYQIQKDGDKSYLVVTINPDDPNYKIMRIVDNCAFGLGVKVTITEGSKEIKFAGAGEFSGVVEITKKEEPVVDNSKLSLEKTSKVSDDMGRIDYEIKVTSTGKNDKVRISDQYKHDARNENDTANKSSGLLTLDKSSVQITSNKQGDLKNKVSYGVEGDMLRLDDINLADGEVVTIKYSCSVNPTYAGNPTRILYAGNGATVYKDDQWQDSKETRDKVYEYKTDLKKTVESISDDKKTITYKITINENKTAYLNGNEVHDYLSGTQAKYANFSGEGIYVNGRLVKWGTEQLTSLENANKYENSKKQFYYYLPNIGKNKVEITYTVTVETDKILTSGNLHNNVDMWSFNKDEGVTVPYKPEEGNKLTVQKTAGEIINNDTVPWTIEFNVPAAGYEKCEIKETLPHIEYQGVKYVDQFNGVFSATAADGRQLYYTTNLETSSGYNTPNILRIKFYKDAACKTKGILPGSTNTQVTVKLQTTLNQEWVEKATENVYWSDLNTHKNEARVDANSSSVTAYAQVEKIFSNNLKKSVQSSDVDYNGMKVPVFKYTISLTGVNQDEIEIEDTFDSCMEIYNEDNDQAPLIRDGSWSWDTRKRGTVVSSERNGDKTTVKIRFNEVPKVNGGYDTKYFVSYTLVPKGEEGLNELRNLAAKENGHKLINTAKWMGKTSSAEATYTYVTDSVGKTETNPPTAENNWTGTFKIVLNKGRVTYGNEDYLDVYDFMTNLSLVKDSVQVVYYDGVNTSAPEKLTPVWDSVQGAWKFTIRNGVQADITYDAKVVGIIGKVNYSNYVTFWGYKSDVGRKETIVDRAAGTMAPQVLELEKLSVGREPIAGAEFTLYRWKNDGNENITNNDDNAWEAVTGNSGAVKRVTDANGHATFFGDASVDGWTLHVDEFYAVKETKAPRGYKQDNLYHPFMIQADRALSGTPECQVIFIPIGEDGAFALTNEKLPTTEFSIKKVEKDEEGNLTNAALPGAVFSLIPKDEDSLTPQQTLTTGEDGKVTFTNIHPGEYTLTETQAPAGYEKADPSVWTVTVTEENDKWTVTGDANLTFEIGNKNDGKDASGSTEYIARVGNAHEKPKTGSIAVKKELSGDVTDAEISTLLNGIKFKVEKLTEDESGRSQVDSSFAAKELTHKGNGDFGSLTDLPIGDYRITEEGGNASGKAFTTEFTGDGFARVEDGSTAAATFSISTEKPDLTLNVKNTYKTKTIKVKKIVVGGSGEESTGTYYFELFRKAAGGSDFDPVIAVAKDGSAEWYYPINGGQEVEVVGYKTSGAGAVIPLSDEETYYIVEHSNKWSSGYYGAPRGFADTYKVSGTESETVTVQHKTEEGSNNDVDVLTFSLGASSDTTVEITNTKKGSADLRIHKTVVNDYGPEEIRNDVYSILNSVKFKITNIDSGYTINFQGYVGKVSIWGERYKNDRAVGSDGKTYDTTYDNNAHWTIYDIPAGRYTVEEVADGWTFGDNVKTQHPELTRVTKYDLTADEYYGYNGEWSSSKTNEREFSWWANEHPAQDDDYSKFVATVAAGGSTPTIQVLNYYSTPVAQIKATKQYNGTWPEGGFSFRLTPLDGAEMTKDAGTSELINDVATVTAPGEEAVWDPIEYIGEGVRRYQISEIIPKGAVETEVNGQRYMLYDGILYDPEPYEVEVNVNQGYWQWTKTRTLYRDTSRQHQVTIDDEDFYGVKADVTYYRNGEKAEAGAAFRNMESQPAEYKPWAAKTIKYLANGASKTLSFRLIDTDTGEEIDSLTKVFTGSGTTVFEFPNTITYTTAGTHHYRVEETDSNGAASVSPPEGITFDVNVTYNADGSLRVAATNDDRVNNIGARKITNLYPLEGKTAVTIQKELVGRDITASDDFEIEITKNNEPWKTVRMPYGGSITNKDVELDGFNQATAQKYMDEHKSDVYRFTEKNTEQTGITYDTNFFIVTVTPSIDEANGKIDIAVEKSADNIKFVNTYAASGTLSLETKKTLNGNKTLEADKYSFELKDANGDLLQTKQNAADGSVKFDNIDYTLADLGGEKSRTFDYTVNEIVPSEGGETVVINGKNCIKKDGITYDPTVYRISVTVTDSGNGTLDVAKSGDIAALTNTGFVNSYDESGKLAFKVKKNINKWTDNMSFTFKLYDGDTELKTWVLDADHKESDLFEVTVDASEAGTTHNYRLTELPGGEGYKGITYDPDASKLVPVTWTSNGSGTLEPFKNGSKVDSGALSVSFNNTYDATGSFAPKVTKSITGMKLNKEFTFRLTDEAGQELDTVTIGSRGSNKSSDTAVFETQSYGLTDVGQTYTYHISEVIPEGAVDGRFEGIAYDTTDHVITVALSDDGVGHITKSITVDGESKADDAEVNIGFNNVYTTAGEVTLNAKKRVTDGTRDLDIASLGLNNKFEFELKDANGGRIDTAKTDATGLVTFDPISYTEAGRYTYTIEEISVDADGYTKKTDAQEVVVTVTDNGDGTLEAVPEYGNAFPEFVNEFTANASVSLSGKKTLDGASSEAKTFSFNLIPEESQSDASKNARNTSVIYEPGMDGDREFAFDDLTYDLSDLAGAVEKKFYYRIVEADAGNGVQKTGTTEYVMQVDLKLENGALTADKEVKAVTDQNKGFWATLRDNIFNGGNDSIVFNNKYEAKGSLELNGNKSFARNDGTLSLAGFTFSVRDEKDDVVARGESDGNGVISYTVTDAKYGEGKTLKYTRADIGTKTYTITEDTKDGYLGVDPKTLEVSIADNGDGTLRVTAGNSSEKLSFINTPLELNISKRDATTGEELAGAVLTLTGDSLAEPISWTSDGSNKTIYGLKAGTYTLTESAEGTPAGYETATAATIELKADNTVEVKDSEDIVKAANGNVTNLVIVNDRVKPVTIRKVDAEDHSKILKGAQFTVTYQDGRALPDGTVEDRMASDGTITLKGLETGKVYMLSENKAPKGYAVAENVEFKIRSDRSIEIISGADNAEVSDDNLSITVSDKPVVFYLVKYDEAGKKLPGAVWQITDADGNEVMGNLTSLGEGKRLKISHLAPGTYRLVETSAPEGYKLAAPVEFVIDRTGAVKIGGQAVTDIDGAYLVTMSDEKIDELSFSGRKIWVDGENGNDTRPDSITVVLERKLAQDLGWPDEPYVTKTVTKADNFYFTFNDQDEDVKKAGKRLFKTNEFGREYEYRIREIVDSETARKYIAVNDGLAVQTEEYGDTYVITNRLKQETVSVNVAKTWQTGRVTTDDIYTGFTATLQKKTGTGYVDIESKPVPKEGSITFEGLDKYDEDGYDIVYRIKETGENNTYYWTEQSVKQAEGTDKTDGRADNVINLALLNDHNEQKAEALIEGVKTMSDDSAGQAKSLAGFRFGLYQDDKGLKPVRRDGKELTAVTDADGKFAFDVINYTEDETGTHTYYIKEIDEGKSGYTYDPNAYPVTVKVEYNANRSAISAEVQYVKGNTVNNEYHANGRFTLNLTKAMTGNYWPEGAEFDFRITDNGGDARTVKLGRDKFSEGITYEYSAEGDHEYVITELDKDGNAVSKAATKDGITYDDPKTVNVSFVDDGEGHLKAFVNGAETAETSKTVSFENSYDAEGIFSMKGSKSLNKGVIADGQYVVEITRTDVDPQDTVEVPVGSDGKWSFPEKFARYTLSDVGTTPSFTVTEKNTGVAGVIYDEASYEVRLTIKDNADGTLDVRPTVADNTITFVNTIPGEGEAVVEASKTVDGMELTDDYTFTLTPDAGNGLGEVTQSVNNKGSKAVFNLKYEAEKVNLARGKSKAFKYKLSEAKGTKGGVNYDDRVYDVTVTVTNNGESLDTAVSYDNGPAEFKNTYSVSGNTSVVIEKKLLSDGEETDQYPAEGFTFKLKDDKGDVKDSKTVTAANKTAVFDGDYFNYTQEDVKENNKYVETATKYYYITEEKQNAAGITYDEATAVVEVKLTNKDGELKVDKKVKKAEGTVTESPEGILARLQSLFGMGEEASGPDAVFINRLEKGGEIGIDGQKLLKYADGSDVIMTDELKAQLTNLIFTVTGNGQTVTGTVDSDGRVTFDKDITFSRPGDYEFRVSEAWKDSNSRTGFDLDWRDGRTFTVHVTDDPENYSRLTAEMDPVDDARIVLSGDRRVFTFTCKDTMKKELRILKSFGGEGDVNATLTLYKKYLIGRGEVASWPVSRLTGGYTFNGGLDSGKYLLVETDVPEGYEKAPDVEFEVLENGKYIKDGVEYGQTIEVPMNNITTDESDTSLVITKKWNDRYNTEGADLTKRPTAYAQIQQSVRAAGSDENAWSEYKNYGAPVAVSLQPDGKTYRYETDKLPKIRYNTDTYSYDEYRYRVKEVKIDGYESGVYAGETISGYEYSYSLVNTQEQKYIRIPVRKVWDDNKTASAHPDIEFTLYADGEPVQTITLKAGQTEAEFAGSAGMGLKVYDDTTDYHEIRYTVSEKQPAGYKTPVIRQNNAADVTKGFTVINESIKTKIKKYDANDSSARPKELEGAVFTINKVGGGWSASFRSGQTLEYAIGSAGSGGIVPGDYEMRETKAPYGYARSSVVAHFTVGEDGTVTQTDSWLKSNWDKEGAICFEDKPLYGAFRFMKVDGETEEPLSGAEFKLYSDSSYTSGSRILSNYIAGENVVYELGTYTSGSDGMIEIENLQWGTYYLEETKAPDGYALPENNIFIFDVDETHNTPDSGDYLELHYIANDKTPPPSSSSSSSTSSTSSTSSSTAGTTTSSSTPGTTETTGTTGTSGTAGTRTASTSGSSSDGRYLTGVLGERKGGVLSSVLGTRKIDDSGVLGERMSPVTGDDLTLNFWIMVLCAAGLIAMSFVYSDDDEEEGEEGKKKAGRRRRARVKTQK